MDQVCCIDGCDAPAVVFRAIVPASAGIYFNRGVCREHSTCCMPGCGAPWAGLEQATFTEDGVTSAPRLVPVCEGHALPFADVPRRRDE